MNDHANAENQTANRQTNRPAKPEGSTWTDEQWEAIRLRGSDILVAAAAGSGKTAVLVERIIRRITDEHDPVDVDRLLVATFTNAAAGEMRQRIREAIEKRLLQQPNSDHLRRQIALIHRASITTLHSFCLDVIRRHYQRIELDPSFRIANETEAELMRQDLLSDLLEEQYGLHAEDSPFWSLADAFGGERGDDALFRLIQQLYDYSQSHPWPAHWLRETARRLDPDAGIAVGASDPWTRTLLADVKLELEGMAAALEEAVRLAESPGGPAPYSANLKDDLAQIRRALYAADRSWEALFHAFQEIGFGKLNACRGGDVDKALQEQVKQLRDAVKKQLADIREELFERSPEQFTAEMRAMAPLAQTLAELVIEFGERYRQLKADKGLVDFSDLEHYCLRILRDPDSTPDRLLASDAALEYREQFVEILLDEYQDTNTVQEAIVELIARPAPGNRFMVGDVKQSIYRFRLAEPGLFMAKYKSYEPAHTDHPAGGRKIDLSRNFRSRQQIVDGVNYIFKQVMTERVGEMDYDEAARLVCGAAYPDSPNDLKAELVLIDRGNSLPEADEDGKSSFDPDEGDEETASADGASWLEQEEQQAETAQLEARFIAAQIRKQMGMDGDPPFQVFDRGQGGLRPIVFRDIVILLRATSQWAPVFLEELRAAGIPAYAELNTGYFTATEVEMVLSLLQIIDNPYQDIPLAAALRSPMFGLTAEELAIVRIHGKSLPFYEAVMACAEAGDGDERGADEALRSKLTRFLSRLAGWREEARQGSLAHLIWNIYRETGIYDFAGGMPGGVQRQANLRALYDRARQFESTSFRGLFRFLRFVERMRDSGADLGAARALGEQEDVVRLMSIHKSKGLEFPVVYVAGLGKTFNQTDLNSTFLLHKELGFGPMYVDPELRVACPTLPMLAIKRRMRMEMVAEELRVLYVALTRPKEKMIMVGTVRSMEKTARKWARMQTADGWELPAYEMAKARCCLDWLGPALIRHPQAGMLRVWNDGVERACPAIVAEDPSQWSAGIVPSIGFAQAAAAAEARTPDERLEAVARLEPVPVSDPEMTARLERQFGWTYPFSQASAMFSKTSVSELKRLAEREFGRHEEEAPDMAPSSSQRLAGTGASALQTFARRPKFLEKQAMTAAERGTVYHAVMQHVPLDRDVTEQSVRSTLDDMVARQLLLPEQRDAVNAELVAAFFREEIGMRLLRAERVYREVPFSYGIQAGEVYPDADASVRGEMLLVQGVIDCLFDEGDGLVLLDYKTDAVSGGRLDMLKQRYGVQLALYARAIEHIWKRPVKERALFFFDGPHMVQLPGNGNSNS